MQGKEIRYSETVRSEKFRAFLRRKRQFLVPMTVFFLAFYFALPVLTSYFTFLNKEAIGAISWAWLFAFAQFVMTWTWCIWYSKKAARFDETVNELKKEMGVQ